MTWSGNHAIRVMALRDGELCDEHVPEVVAAFAALGIRGEGLGIYPMVSLCIPMDADFAAVKSPLDEGHAAGRWAWEEGCVGEVWLDL